MPLDAFKKIAYPVPAKDSVQFVYLFCNLITKTFLYEQKKMGLEGIEDVTAGELAVQKAEKDEN